MKRFFSTVFLSTALTSLALLSLSSCNKDPESEGKDLAVTLEKGEATETTLAFTVNPSNAEKCAYWYGTTDETVPSADDIIASGTPVGVSEKTSVVIEDLAPSTEYVIVAAVSRKGELLISEPLEMATTGKEFMLLDAVYSDANSAGAGNYSIALGNADVNENWEPAEVGDMFVSLELYNERDSDPINAVLPDGEYSPGSDKSPFTWDPSASYLCIRIDDTAEGVKYMPFVSGAVKVARNGNSYSINVDLTLLEGGENITVSYDGPIQFVQGATSAGRFEEPQNVTFTAAQGRYYGNWFYPFCDDMLVEFTAGKVDSKGNIIDGYKLQMMYVFTQKLEDTSVSEVPLENGTYTVSYGSTHLQRVPRTFTKGEVTDFYGNLLELGTILKHVDSKTGRTTLGVVAGGEMKLSGSGSSYNVEFNLVTDDGIELKGTYSGPINLENKCDNSSREVLSSTLTADYQLNFPKSTVAMAFYLGDYLHVGLDSWLLYFLGEDPGDTISLEFFTEKGSSTQLTDGTYTVSGDYSEFKARQIIPGFYPRGGGDLPFSWYGDTSSQDQDGNTQKLAPLTGGTMNVSKSAGSYVFNMNFTDDKDFAITGQWSGPVEISDISQASETAVETLKKQIASKVR